MKKKVGPRISDKDYGDIRQAILEQKVVPSMRLLWSSGTAVDKTNVCAYNCSFIVPTRIKDFGEMMYILMCGTGVGFSVENKTVEQLPGIKNQTGELLPKFVVEDSKEGWADAFIHGLDAWFNGKDVEFDYSQLRPEGARLKTMGGRSSGPQPLINLMEFSRAKLLANQGKKLSTLDVHDICCKIGEVVVSGGVRRSAMISLSDLNDEEMQNAKSGEFWNNNPQRFMANNSAVYNEKPNIGEFLKEWTALVKSGTGERGIFNRGSLEKQLPARRWEKFKTFAQTCGTNPCGEIILRNRQFCNLTSIVAREDDTPESLMEKIRLATILGTYQASLTDFKYLSDEWKINSEEEALLGVSITGAWDCPIIRDAHLLRKLRDHSIEVNDEYAVKLGINPSTCVTCIKPSGNSSQFLDTSSGLHPRHSKYYIRRVRISKTDPLFRMMAEQGVKYHPEVGQTMENAHTFVLEFPVESPDGVYKDDLSAIEQLENWKLFKENFTEHNPSVTISVGDDEWIQTADWIYKNWDIIGGLSFLPRDNHVYQLAPYEAIDKHTYEEMAAAFPDIDYSKIFDYEREDETQGAKEYACVGNSCEIV
ncbi:MAG: ribonucleoside-triphosphate reductase [Chlorobiota bacterium]|nr:MAG: ribonucleoside-triphosphate reductase [Chlorobiota bacterium]